MPPAATTWWSPQTRRCTRRNDWAEIESPWSNGPGPQEDTLPHPELNLTQAFKELVQIGITLTSEHDLAILLERVLDTARRFTRAEAGTLFLREGDHLRFAVVQNDFLQRKLGTVAMQQRLQSEPLRLTEPSLAGHVAQTGEIVNVADAYAIGVHETRALNRRFDAASEYSTRSVLAVPMHDLARSNVGVLELLTALDESGAVVPFHPADEKGTRALA